MAMNDIDGLIDTDTVDDNRRHELLLSTCNLERDPTGWFKPVPRDIIADDHNDLVIKAYQYLRKIKKHLFMEMLSKS